MNKRLNIILFFYFFTIVLQGQELKSRQIKKIESFGIEYSRLKDEKIDYSDNFSEILILDKKTKKNKTIGYVFSSLGLLTATGGILILSNIKNSPNNEMDEAGGFRSVIGGFFTSIGVIEIGVSIPLLISSKKRKKERNLLIKELNPNFKE